MPETSLFSHILVPTDGSDYSIAAGRLAVGLARVHSARLTFLYVVDEVVLGELTRLGKAEDQARRELENTGRSVLSYLQRLATDHGIPAAVLLRRGLPHAEILSVAKSADVDLIVIGQVGIKGPRRLLIGSVAERVIEFAQCPVLVAKR